MDGQIYESSAQRWIVAEFVWAGAGSLGVKKRTGKKRSEVELHKASTATYKKKLSEDCVK